MFVKRYRRMKINNIVLAAIIIAMGLIGGGIALSNGIVKFKSMERTVSVKGLSETEVPADKVLWNISFSCQGNNMSNLFAEVDKNVKVIAAYLKKGGISENEIFTASPSLTDLAKQYAYASKKPEYNYEIYTSLTVSSSKINEVRSLISTIASDMSKEGIAVNGYANYSFTGLNELKPKMIEEATANARASAQKFAEDSHSKIGKIKTANQGIFSVEDLDETTPYMKKVRVVTTVVYYLN